MNALEIRRQRVAYAKSIGVAKPSTLKKDELEAAIAEAEANHPKETDVTPVVATSQVGENTNTGAPQPTDDDPFDDIDPELEGDHLSPEDEAKVVDATREAWLLSAVDKLRTLAAQGGAIVPRNIAVSVGFSGTGRIKSVRGSCYKTSVCEEKKNNNIFISPILKDPIDVLRTLLHELIHASDDNESGHKGHFAKVAKALGFVNKMSSFEAGDDLRAILADIAAELGEYPHLALSVEDLQGTKQSTRLLKAQCPECNGMPIRVTKKYADTLPYCGEGCEDDNGYPVRFVVC